METNITSTVVSIMMGIGLSAAAGFRVFIPFLIMGLASKCGLMEPPKDFSWIVSWPAIIAFATATCFEVFAYYIPFVDNLLDSIATPAAVVAGVIVSYVAAEDMHPLFQWGVALIGGGGASSVVQIGTTTVRGMSTATTAGMGNPLVSTFEAIAASALSILAIIIAPLAFVIVCFIIYKLIFKIINKRKKMSIYQT